MWSMYTRERVDVSLPRQNTSSLAGKDVARVSAPVSFASLVPTTAGRFQEAGMVTCHWPSLQPTVGGSRKMDLPPYLK